RDFLGGRSRGRLRLLCRCRSGRKCPERNDTGGSDQAYQGGLLSWYGDEKSWARSVDRFAHGSILTTESRIVHRAVTTPQTTRSTSSSPRSTKVAVTVRSASSGSEMRIRAPY